MDAVATIEESAWGVAPAESDTATRVMLTAHTTGIFPTAVAVARVVPGISTADPEPAHRWAIWTLKTEDAAYWNVLMTDVAMVREVVCLRSRSAGETVAIDDMVRTARVRDAGLCVIYGVTSTELDNYRMSALVIETTTGEKVAVVRASAGPNDFEARKPGEHHNDMRMQDPSFICARKLQAGVRALLMEMAGHNGPTTTQPSPWQGSPSTPPQTYIVLPH